MKCRGCETSALDELERDGVTIDVCQQCRGIWLDRGELERLLARAVEQEDVSDRPNAREQDDDDDHDRRGARRHHEERADQEDRGYADGRGRKRRWYKSLTNTFD